MVIYNSSGYEQTIHDMNLQLIELQLYTKKIAGCLDIAVLLSARRKDHQLKTLKMFYYFYKYIIYK